MATSTSPSATCSLCSELYIDPRMLQCLHTFCSKCLKQVVEKQRSKATLKCPTCKASEKLPKGGVDALPKDLRKSYEAEVAQYTIKMHSKEEISCDQCVDASNGPAVSFCVNCCEFLCNACTKHHKSWRKTLNHELQPVGGAKQESKKVAKALTNVPYRPLICQLHEDETLKFYCNTCSTLICRDCMAIEHSGHAYDRIEKVAEKEKGNLLTALQTAEQAKAKLGEATAKGGKVKQQVMNRQKEVEKDIRSTFKMLVDALSKREKALLAKTAKISLGKQTALTMQEEEFQKLHKEIAEACELIKVATQVHNPAEMLSAKGLMTNRLQQLLKCYKAISLEPCRNDMIASVLDTAEVLEKITSFGAVLGGSCPSEAKTEFYLPRAMAGREKKITITTSDMHGRRFPHGGESVEVSLSLMGSNDPALSAKVIDKKNGTYIASFTPRKPGEHQLSITIDNMHIKGSPIPVYVRQQRSYTSNSAYQRYFNLSGSPYDVAVDDNGDIYVAVFSSNCIEVYSQDGSRIRTIGTPSQNSSAVYYGLGQVSTPGNLQLQSPSAIAVTEGMLYVTEYGKNCVQKITTSGKFLSKFGEGQLKNPHGICIDHSSGRVFVSSSGNNQSTAMMTVCLVSSGNNFDGVMSSSFDNSVAIFEADGTFVSHFTNGNLNSPWGLAFDNSGNLHVASKNTASIVVFTREGEYVSTYNSGVNQPAGIAIDEEGNTFVADFQAGGYSNAAQLGNYSMRQQQRLRTITMLNSQHQVIASWEAGQCATGITLDKEGSIYICNFYSSFCVYKY